MFQHHFFCHCLSMRLNCLTGLPLGIVGITITSPVTCMFRISVPLCPVFPHSLHLALGQRQSRMSYSSCCYLMPRSAALEGHLLTVFTILLTVRCLIAY